VPVGTYAVGDDARASLPDELTRVVFGTATSDDKGTP
jgi:hypothetical protein